MKLTISQKLSLNSVFLVLISAGLVGVIFYNKTSAFLIDSALNEVAKEVRNAEERLKILLGTQDEDALFLAKTPPIQGILRAQNQSGYDTLGKTSGTEWKKRLEIIFASQLQVKADYLSISYLDAKGQELVVVKRSHQNIVKVRGEKLQNQYLRDYVLKALTVPAGSVYVSEVNLNREFGKLIQPRQEVIRSLTPIYNEKDSSLAGLISITAEIGGKLRDIQKSVRETADVEIYITNDRGDYLLHPDSRKMYGFEYRNNYSIQKDILQLTTLFSKKNNDNKINLTSKQNKGWQALHLSKIRFDPHNIQRFLAVVVTHDYKKISIEKSKLLNDIILWTLLFISTGIIIGIRSSIKLTEPINQITQAMDDYINHRDKHETLPVNLNNEIGVMARNYQLLTQKVELANDELSQMNSTLEAKVNERTKLLKMSEQRQRSIVDNILDGLITIDNKGSITSFNPAASKIFGYSFSEVMGCNIKILMPEPYISGHDDYLRNFLTTGEKKVTGIGREVVGKRKDGTTFPMELSVSEIEINGELVYTGIVRDITERILAELKFHEMDAMRRGILDSAGISIISTTIEGMILSFNPCAERMLGYTADEMINKQSPAIFHDVNEVVARAKALSNELGKEIEPGFETFIAKAHMGMADEHEWTYVRKDGSRFTVLLSVTAIRNKNNEVKAYLGIALDITERKRLDRMKSEFISTVSHELRTPLTSIRGALGLILGGGVGKVPESLLKLLEMANRNSERLSLLINDILDLEKIESGELDIDLKPCDLVALTRQAIADNEGYAAKHQVRLSLQTNLEHAQVLGDSHRLLQVFSNLISNAVKYSYKNGRVELSISLHDKNYRIAVRDYGSGIPKEFHNKIFQRFAQVDSSDTREKGGTGLGLNISQAIIKRHNGRIDYESEPGEGTIFYFDLPTSQSTLIEHSEVIAGPRILICEENPEVAEILSGMLGKEKLICDIAANAVAARKLLSKKTYPLILLDLDLPDIDGLQFLQEIRRLPATKEIPIIIVSAEIEGKLPELYCDGLTVIDWIQKPVDEDKLQGVVKNALQRKEQPRILHVEDDLDVVQVVHSLLGDNNYILQVSTVKGCRELLNTEYFDLAILDLGLADGSGLELLDELKTRCPVVIFSAQHPDREISRQVAASLTKSMTSNEQLLATIKSILNQSFL